MTRTEYQELTDFFVDQLGKVREETRTIVQVTVESLRHEIRIVADGVLANGHRIEENGRRIEENGRRIEENGRRIDALATRLAGLSNRVQRIENGLFNG